MSAYTPKVGDRVRVVVEGEVHQAHHTGRIWLKEDGGLLSTLVDEHIVNVEKVDTPVRGLDVVLRDDGTTLAFREGGDWSIAYGASDVDTSGFADDVVLKWGNPVWLVRDGKVVTP